MLVVGAGEDQVSYGGIAGRSGAFRPGACVEVYVDDVRIAKTTVTASGTFAVQFQVPGDARSRHLELRLDDVAGDTNERYLLAFPDCRDVWRDMSDRSPREEHRIRDPEWHAPRR